MPVCAFLSMDSLDGFHTSDHLLIPPLNAAGWQVDQVSWRDPGADWDRYDAVVVRTPWDYQHDLAGFLAVLEQIDASRARLANDLGLMTWNLDKRYLRDLDARGIAIVPTRWFEDWRADDADAAFAAFDVDEIVVKPVVAAGAHDTFRLDRGALAQRAGELADLFAQRAHMIQPFAPSVLDPGEYSLFYFGGRLGHAIVKRPKPGDFRVQEEHGGLLAAHIPDAALTAAGDAAMAALDAAPLYARADFVLWRNRPVLIEFELVEPSLYLEFDDESPARFVAAFLDWWNG